MPNRTCRTRLLLLTATLLLSTALVSTSLANSTDHVGILRGLGPEQLASGKTIYQNLCVNCHGADGVTAPLPTARAFGKGELKFGADPLSMFNVLTEGRGLMGAQTWMTPQERYDVIHYIRETFMKDTNPAYKAVDEAYLADLPAVTEKATDTSKKDCDYGPALASQFTRDVSSALNIKLGDELGYAVNLHTLDAAALWNGDFLNLSATQHKRLRGEGVVNPGGEPISGLQTFAWAHNGSFDYPTDELLARGPLPAEWLTYHGHYVHGRTVALKYEINGRGVFESPRAVAGLRGMAHQFEIASGDALQLAVGQLQAAGDTANVAGFLDPAATSVQLLNVEPGASANDAGAILVTGTQGGPYIAAAIHAGAASTPPFAWSVDDKQRLVLTIPRSDMKMAFQVTRIHAANDAELLSFASYVRAETAKKNDYALDHFTVGGAELWDADVTTSGTLGPDDVAYTLDTITLPESTPWNSWFRTSALDFFPDGRLVLATHGGDIWIVEGVDDELKSMRWHRFASGLYEPFGVKVVGGKIHVTCKDRLTRLHDLNGNGEADFYESFSADDDVSTFFHAFNFGLVTDTDGNFYYAKSGQYTDYKLPGSVIKVSPDGKRRSVHCTGFRTPNGIGITPDDRITVSDNQGSWMPASKVSLTREGGFYGYVQTHTRPGKWQPDGGKINAKKVVPPQTFDQPIIWMPQNVDNSSGGQVFAGDERWGPLAGKLLHTSFGKGWLFYLMQQTVGDAEQAALVRLPLDFDSGIQRARVGPHDGQLYATGLNGWNGGGRKGLSEGCIQRVRYTGADATLLLDTQVQKDAIVLTLNERLTDVKPGQFAIRQWNYKWTQGYGSKQFSVREPAKTKPDKVDVKSVRQDGKSITLELPELVPVHQLHIKINHPAFEEEIYLTINAVPEE